MKDTLTLQEFITKETERKSTQLTTTTGFIEKLTERKDAATDVTEQNRLQGLIDLHTNFLSEVNGWDVTVMATERFNKQEERKSKVLPPTN